MFQIPLAWTLAIGLELGVPGVLWAIPVAETAFAIAALVLFRRGRWKTARA